MIAVLLIVTSGSFRLEAPAIEDRVAVVIEGVTFAQPRDFVPPVGAGERVLVNEIRRWSDGREYVHAWQYNGAASRAYMPGGQYKWKWLP
jgi:hypothetical protein